VVLRLEEALPAHMRPSQLFIVPSIPLTATGKADRKVLAHWWREATPTPPMPLASPEPSNGDGAGVADEGGVEAWLRQVWGDVLGRAVSADQSTAGFLALGGDSIKAVQVLWRVREEFGVDILLDDLEAGVTPLARLLLQARQGRRTPGDSVGITPASDGSRKRQRLSREPVPAAPVSNIAVGRNGVCVTEDLLDLRSQVTSLLDAKVASISSLSLRQRWVAGLGKCIDATPLATLPVRKQGMATFELVPSEPARIFVGSHSHVMVSVDAATGRELWRTELGGRIEGSATLSADGSRVLVGCYDHRLYALSVEDGRVLWDFLTGGEIKGAPLSIPSSTGAPSTVCFASYDGVMYGLEEASGRLTFRARLGGSAFASPVPLHAVAVDGLGPAICTCTTKGSVVAWTLTAEDGGGDGDLLSQWRVDLQAPVFSTPVVAAHGKAIVLGVTDGSVRCLARTDGNPLWTCTAGGPIFSSPVLSAGMANVLIGCHDGMLRCLGIQDGSLIWSRQLGAPVAATPAVFHSADDCPRIELLAAATTQGHVCILSAGTGEVLHRATLPGKIFSSPLVFNNALVIGCRDDLMYCFDLTG
jgi:outer membrane protein assembly factor BamB/aryl carrier-like protein